MILNDYPTVTPSEFAQTALDRVDTLINNMRVNNMRVNFERNPKSKANWLIARQKNKDNAISKTDTVVIQGRKPKLQTIRKPTNGQIAIIDWINITFDIATIGEKYRRTNEDDDKYHAICQEAVAQFAPTLAKMFGKPYAIIKQNQNGANFYKYSFDFGQGYGKICIGGQRDTVLLMLNGTGCSLAPQGFEHHIHTFLTKHAVKPKITRIDLAHDDLYGEYLDVRVLDDLETQGLFHCGGAPHTVGHVGNWKYDDPTNKGLTLNLGMRESGKFSRFYERGKKFGDKQGEFSNWVRAEVEFKANDRVIPFDVLLDPSSYFMGAYPIFADLFAYEKIEKLEIVQKTAAVTLNHSFDWINRQAGKYLSFYRKFMSDSEILDLLSSEDENDIPKRLHLSDAFCKQQDKQGNVLLPTYSSQKLELRMMMPVLLAMMPINQPIKREAIC